MKQFIGLLFLTIAISPRSLQFTKTLTCIQEDAIKCTQWNQSTVLSYSYYLPNSFAEDTYVVTHLGPKSMKDLQINDQILAYDQQEGKIYSKVVAWLHRDTQSFSKYHTIKTKQGPSFQASEHHNIAIVGKSGKLDFKFTKDLNIEDDLAENDYHIQGIMPQGLKKGLYSPFTQVGNYYILDSSTNREIRNTDNIPMILVHVLPQVKNPQQEIVIAKKIVQLQNYFGLNKQPKDDESYSHPLTTHLNFVFGRNWVSSQHEITYEIKRDPSSASYSLADSNSIYTSSDQQQQQQQRNRIFAAGLSLDMIFGVVLM